MQVSAVAKGESSQITAEPPQATKAAQPVVSLKTRLEQKLKAARKHRSVILFFENHRSLLSSSEHRPVAIAARRRAERRLARVTRTIVALRRALERREARRLANAPPKVAICRVFGRRYCDQALKVAWCESHHSTAAQNGQYLGLFQMGSSERRLFGHGQKAHQQAIAAHKYFVLSGRDWSPWSCKPWYGYS
ncbi:MAG: hypothetical protein ACR2G9_00170 [Gaiellaceae bacterium]